MNDPGEHAELEAFRDFYGMLEQHGAGRRLEIGGAVCGAVEGLRDMLMANRVLGLGIERPATSADLETVEEFFCETGTRYYVSVSPAAEGLAELLEERGYEHGYAWAIFRRGVEPYEAASELRAEEIGPDAAEQFGEVVVRSYEMPDQARAPIAAVVGRRGWHCWITYEHDDSAGAAAMFVYGRAAWFGFAGTLPEHWSPDGKRLAYAESRTHGHTSVVVIDASSGRVESVIPFRRPTDVVAWRPG